MQTLLRSITYGFSISSKMASTKAFMTGRVYTWEYSCEVSEWTPAWLTSCGHTTQFLWRPFWWSWYTIQGRWKQLKSGSAPNTEVVQQSSISHAVCQKNSLNCQEAALSMKMCSQYTFITFLCTRERCVCKTFEYWLLDHRKVIQPKPDQSDRPAIGK